MDVLFAKDKRAILHQRARQKLADEQHKQEERKYRLWKLKREERRDAFWFRTGHITIGILIGLVMGGLYFQVNSGAVQNVPLLSQPIELN